MTKTTYKDIRHYFLTNGELGMVRITAQLRHGTRKFYARAEGEWTHEGLAKDIFWVFKDARHNQVADPKLVLLFKLRLEHHFRAIVKQQAPKQLMEEVKHLRRTAQRMDEEIAEIRSALKRLGESM